MVLRGGSSGPNYDSVHIKLAEVELDKAGLSSNIMVDCSHANSEKKPELQPAVAQNVIQQIVDGKTSIIGLMLESNLKAGKQSLGSDLSTLEYGVSITDGCISFEETEQLLRSACDALAGS